MFEERTFAPTPPLRPWIAEIRIMSMAASPARTLTRLPNGTSSLVLCTRHGGTEVVAAGPNMRASYKPAEAVPLYARFVFRPGSARAFLGVALHELTNRVVSVDELWGRNAARWRDRLEGGSLQATIHTLEAALLEQLDPKQVDPWRERLVRGAVKELEEAPHATLSEVAARLGVGERRFRQVFREEIGLSPKRFARIARIRRVLAKAGRTAWAQLAAEAGFFDQAHLVAEFRDLLGVAPTSFLAGDLPARAACAVASG
ncbi:AraC family transcriptional regulator [Pendulispora rubella]|uniref:AraC family transcriptional regulator n=1 Tax=Pendulispora rubella TaxID=2741070 RepID=A0ABZ2L4L6_9BACT